MHCASLGWTGVPVSRLCLGTATFGAGPLPDDAVRLVHHALDIGVNFFDTANSYGNQPRFDRPGAPPAAVRESAEEILGRALRGKRDEVVLSSKVMEPVGPGPLDRGLSRPHVLREVERSLLRLSTDHLDILHAHHPDPSVPLEETLGAFDELVQVGKVRYVALSTFPAWLMTKAATLAECHSWARPVCLQTRYSLIHREVETETIPAVLSAGMTINPFSPLAGGLLAGAAARNREIVGLARFGSPTKFRPGDLEKAAPLDDVAEALGEPPSRLSIAWLLSRPAVGSVIVGSETVEELDDAAAAVEIELDASALGLLDPIGKPEIDPFVAMVAESAVRHPDAMT